VQALETVGINFFGTLRISNALIPLLRPQARIVNVASMAGISAINSLDEEKRARIRDPAIGEAQLCAFMQEFVDAAAKGDVQAQGWPENSYGMSKLGIIAVRADQSTRQLRVLRFGCATHCVCMAARACPCSCVAAWPAG
jgi:carbonyl reductase 1